MAVRVQADVVVKVTTSSATAAFQDISQSVMTISGVKLEAITEESDAFGDSWIENLYTGIRRMGSLVLGGIYDDVAASGPMAIFGNASDIGAERVVKINVGTTASGVLKTDVIVKSFERQISRGALTRWETELLPSGAVITNAAT